MQKRNEKNCLFWFIGTLASSIISVLLIILAIYVHFPEIDKLLVGLISGLWVTLSLVWGAHQIKQAEWDDELVVLLNFVAILFAVVGGGALFTLALLQVVPG
ncbi:hypothetical protein JKG47_07160 [Acidithiobacillus sp. MC6.1]|nr:hypothetical protein [Acidithiobacillus sp. MC6.1]